MRLGEYHIVSRCYLTTHRSWNEYFNRRIDSPMYTEGVYRILSSFLGSCVTRFSRFMIYQISSPSRLAFHGARTRVHSTSRFMDRAMLATCLPYFTFFAAPVAVLPDLQADSERGETVGIAQRQRAHARLAATSPRRVGTGSWSS